MATQPSAERPIAPEPLDAALIALIQNLPLVWKSVDWENLPSTDQEALRLAIKVAVVEARLLCTASMKGFSDAMQLHVCVSGDFDPELRRMILSEMPAEWRDGNGQWLARRRVGTVWSQVRLTPEGLKVRQKLTNGDVSDVLDYVHRRGQYSDWWPPEALAKVSLESRVMKRKLAEVPVVGPAALAGDAENLSKTPAAETEQDEGNDNDLDRKFMERAVEEARKSRTEDNRVHPKVGVVIVKDGKELAVAYRGELKEGEHAEFTAMEGKLPYVEIAGATVYTTLEPCTSRNHPKLPCAVRLIERKVKRVVIGMHDPNPTISGKGFLKLRDANIAIDLFPPDLMSKIEEMNREFIRHHKNAAEPALLEALFKWMRRVLVRLWP